MNKQAKETKEEFYNTMGCEVKDLIRIRDNIKNKNDYFSTLFALAKDLLDAGDIVTTRQLLSRGKWLLDSLSASSSTKTEYIFKEIYNESFIK